VLAVGKAAWNMVARPMMPVSRRRRMNTCRWMTTGYSQA
jgi:hypothetical protein